MVHAFLGFGDTPPLTSIFRSDTQGDSCILGTSSWISHRHLTLIFSFKPGLHTMFLILDFSEGSMSILLHKLETWRSIHPFLSVTSLLTISNSTTEAINLPLKCLGTFSVSLSHPCPKATVIACDRFPTVPRCSVLAVIPYIFHTQPRRLPPQANPFHHFLLKTFHWLLAALRRKQSFLQGPCKPTWHSPAHFPCQPVPPPTPISFRPLCSLCSPLPHHAGFLAQNSLTSPPLLAK